MIFGLWAVHASAAIYRMLRQARRACGHRIEQRKCFDTGETLHCRVREIGQRHGTCGDQVGQEGTTVRLIGNDVAQQFCRNGLQMRKQKFQKCLISQTAGALYILVPPHR